MYLYYHIYVQIKVAKIIRLWMYNVMFILETMTSVLDMYWLQYPCVEVIPMQWVFSMCPGVCVKDVIHDHPLTMYCCPDGFGYEALIIWIILRNFSNSIIIINMLYNNNCLWLVCPKHICFYWYCKVYMYKYRYIWELFCFNSKRVEKIELTC